MRNPQTIDAPGPKLPTFPNFTSCAICSLCVAAQGLLR